MKERFWLKPVSILLGILAWFYVNIFSTTPITREYKVKIAYLNKDDSKNYKVIPESPEVKLRVKGPRGVFIQTKVEDNTFASVDLINCHGGKLTLPVNVIFPANSNLQLVSREPAQLVINAIKMVTKNIKVNVNIIGSLPEGYLSNKPSVYPESLSVSAPEDLIDSIKECRIDLYLDDIKRSISEYRQSYIVYTNDIIETDPKGKLIYIDNNNVKLDLAVKEGYPEKQVSIKPLFINKTPEGKKLDNYTIIPDKITITGPQRLLDKINELTTEAIDLEAIKKSSKLSLNVNCPQGVNIVESNPLKIDIKYIDVLINKEISNLQLEVTHDENQLVEYDVTTYTIELEGYIDDINAIKRSDLKNIIYVKGLSSGTHNINLETPYGFSERIKVKSIKPASIPITIRLMEKINYVPEIKNDTKLKKDTISSNSAIISNSDKSDNIILGSDSQPVASSSDNISQEKTDNPENLSNKE